MHIPDGMLSTPTLAVGWAAGAPVVAWAVRRVRRSVTDGRLVLMSVLAALVFALQMLNFPVAGGTSGHFAGGALAAIVLGPWPAVLIIAAVLAVQAFFFADGGVTALGANMVNMAIVAPFLGWWVYSAAVRISDSRAARIAGAFVAGWIACVAAALGAGLMVWASGSAPLIPVMGAMGFWHALIGVGEGLVTAGLVSYVHAVRPELMKADAEIMRPRGLVISLGATALVAAAVSFVASNSPDGLEHVAESLGFVTTSEPVWRLSPMADYAVPGLANETLAGVLAGIVGVMVTGILLYALLQTARRRRAGSA
jgi:cobalt/nickel transport system permease protein